MFNTGIPFSTQILLVFWEWVEPSSFQPPRPVDDGEKIYRYEMMYQNQIVHEHYEVSMDLKLDDNTHGTGTHKLDDNTHGTGTHRSYGNTNGTGIQKLD